MENETEEVVEVPEEDIELEEVDESATEEVEKQEKPKETPLARKARLERQLKQVRKQLGESDDEPVSKPSKANDSDKLDYGERAFLATYGIKGADEIALAKSWIKRTGDEIDALVDDDVFNARLEKLRANKLTKQAIPSSSKRTTQASADSVDYWLQKPFSEVPLDLRSKVVNARIAKESRHSN